MNKDALIRAVAAEVGSRAVAAEAVEAFFDTIVEAVVSGEGMVVHGFGTFERRDKGARTRRDPRTGAPVELPAQGLPAFRPSRLWKDQVLRGS